MVTVDWKMTLSKPDHISTAKCCLRGFFLNTHFIAGSPVTANPLTAYPNGIQKQHYLSRASSSTLAGSRAARFRLRIWGVAWRGVLGLGCIQRRERDSERKTKQYPIQDTVHWSGKRWWWIPLDSHCTSHIHFVDSPNPFPFLLIYI